MYICIPREMEGSVKERHHTTRAVIVPIFLLSGLKDASLLCDCRVSSIFSPLIQTRSVPTISFLVPGFLLHLKCRMGFDLRFNRRLKRDFARNRDLETLESSRSKTASSLSRMVDSEDSTAARIIAFFCFAIMLNCSSACQSKKCFSKNCNTTGKTD